jgi:amino acid transporter
MKNLKTKILETVKNNDIRMIPKWKFALYSILGVASLLFAFLITIFVMSLILFVLSRYGFMDMPFFGFMQTIHALAAVPLALFLCTIILLVLIEVISHSYSFSFRRPLVITLLLITSIVSLISYLISQTSAHIYVRDYIKSQHLDMLSRVYDRPLLSSAINGMDVLRGEVIAVSATSTVIRLFDGESITAYATTTEGTTTMPLPPTIGDDVVMLGTFNDTRFEIMRIRKAHHGPFGEMVRRNEINEKNASSSNKNYPNRDEKRRQILQLQPQLSH